MGTKNKYESDDGEKERKKPKLEWKTENFQVKEKKKKRKSKSKELSDDDSFTYAPEERVKKEPSKRKSELVHEEAVKREKKTSLSKFEDDSEDEVPTSSKKDQRKSSASEVDEPAASPAKDGKSTDDFFNGWNKNDIFELLNRIQAAIPKNDVLRYKSRTEKLEWDKVQFGKYSAEECKTAWKAIENRIRGFRTLSEVLADAKAWVEEPWTHFYRSGKRNRHPDLPKRPLSSYMIFYLEKKDKYLRKHPGIGMTGLSKLIGEKYKALPPHKKAKYEKLSSAKRVEYQDQMRHFIQEHPAEALKLASNSGPKKVEPGMPGPKKPITPFKLYLQDKTKHYKNDPGFKLPDFTNECKMKWKNLTEKKKYPWINWAHEAEIKYLEELKVYLEENPNVTIPSHKSLLSKEEKVILDRMSGKPDKPPNSAYSLFSRNMLKNTDLSALTPKERLQEIARLWKEIPQNEKDLYGEEVKRLTDTYKMEYAMYLDSLPDDRREEELASQGRGRKGKLAEKAPGSKLKQATLADVLKKGSAKSSAKEEPTSLNFMAQEPKAPPQTTFNFFAESFIKKGKGNEEKAKAAWQSMSQKQKEIYEVKLDTLKQQYYIKYREFLTSLSAEQLKAYSEGKANSGSEGLNENIENDSDEEEASSSDSDSSSSASLSSSSSDSEGPVKAEKSKYSDVKGKSSEKPTAHPANSDEEDSSSSDSDSSDSDSKT